ncbi:alkaline phosphatase [Alkalibacter sp. M17DMB]|nr:alkaline phosphatase [Alkalibacter mobilis]
MFKTVASVAMAGLILAGTMVPTMAARKDSTLLTGKGKDVKNVILLISDGWGSNQILATDYFTDGKAGTQIYENFPAKVNMSTYSFGEPGTEDDLDSVYTSSLWDNFNLLKNNPTDSAAAGTAMSTGTKTYDAAIGVDQELEDLKHIAEDFEELDKATGVVSSVEFSHATPASFVDHNASRNNYSDIANGMIQNSATDVIMGAGNPNFDDNGQLRSTPNYRYVGGEETWEALLAGTLGNDADNDGDIDYWNLIQTKDDFEELQYGNAPDRLIGVPEVYSTLQQSRGGDRYADAFDVPFNDNVPTLEVMTSGALNVLDNNENGFFLMVEGGAVDWAGHANQSGRLIEEQEDFNRAVEAVCNWVEENSNWGETLVIVTGDHETGYLTGTAGVYDEVKNNGAGEMPTMVWNSSNHTNQLIPLFAKGTGAEIFKKLADETDPVKGNYIDNTEISVAMRELIN